MRLRLGACVGLLLILLGGLGLWGCSGEGGGEDTFAPTSAEGADEAPRGSHGLSNN